MSASPGPEKLFQQLEDEIQRLEISKTHLLTLANSMNQDCFDDEDKTMVVQKLQETQQVQQGLQATLDQRRDIYNNQVKKMLSQLDTRKKCLENLDKKTKLFTTFPEILTYFVHKQSRLNQGIEDIKTKLKS